jgi:two-component system response regulator QseB
VTLDGKPIILPKREFSLIRLLLENEGRVLSRQRIEENIYGWNDDVESNAIEVHISHLRKKFGADLIRTLRGVGYTIDKPE